MESLIQSAAVAKHLLPSTLENLQAYLQRLNCEPWEVNSIRELIKRGEWTELNDRFYKTLTFGTGGLRGRTIGKVCTQAETGTVQPLGRPQFPAAGTNSMNFYNIGRATRGLVHYLFKTFPGSKPRVAIAHDTRHFSRDFAEFTAQIIKEMGGVALMFHEDRSTPALSFAVRHAKAHAGVVITASHNPPHDNGFKVYFQDGAQIVEPHASAIIAEVKAADQPVELPDVGPGAIEFFGPEMDDSYQNALSHLVMDPAAFREQARHLHVVFSSIHGTGIRMAPRILQHYGVQVSIVSSQAQPDGRFPTVASPNPENAEALTLAIELATAEKADLVAATDPDADRMGVAVRNPIGQYQLLTGNQIGSILAWFRLNSLFSQGILRPENAHAAALIKTFVTTDLQAAIASHFGVKCINTLTGFKYIGEKLRHYEEAAGGRGDLDPEAWRNVRLQRSTYFVFGGEESYGYSGSDEVRDKDANAAVLMIAEVAAATKAQGRTLLDLLDDLYRRFGVYCEKLGTLTYEGAEGAARIQKLLRSYVEQPPSTWAGRPILRCQNFETDTIHDADGKVIPKEKMLMFYLEGDFRIAVRGSGTEPKVKYYFFGKTPAGGNDIQALRQELTQQLDAMWKWTQHDAGTRAV